MTSALFEVASAVAIGAAFGWALESAGLGSARKLAGLFYFADFTVFKVLFSALVTAAVGLFWLSRLGVVDLALLDLPATFVMPQLVGGLIFGAGFALAGLCP
ncbi:MAG: YeeE/YedE thiosulfate transporter family protein, partial [Thermoanaerobaculia bacterium]